MPESSVQIGHLPFAKNKAILHEIDEGEDLVSTIFFRIFQLEILDYPSRRSGYLESFPVGRTKTVSPCICSHSHLNFRVLGVNGKHPTSSARFHGSYIRQVVFLLHGDTGT